MSMHALSVFLRGHAFSHSDEVVVSSPFSMADNIRAGTNSADRRCMPEGLNSLANQLGYERRNAHGMTRKDSRELAGKIDTDAVWAYRNSVGNRTRAVIEGHELDHWLDPLEQSDLDRAVDLGVIESKAANSMSGFLLGLAKEDLIGWWGLNHSLLHLGESASLLKLLKNRRP